MKYCDKVSGGTEYVSYVLSWGNLEELVVDWLSRCLVVWVYDHCMSTGHDQTDSPAEIGIRMPSTKVKWKIYKQVCHHYLIVACIIPACKRYTVKQETLKPSERGRGKERITVTHDWHAFKEALHPTYDALTSQHLDISMIFTGAVKPG